MIGRKVGGMDTQESQDRHSGDVMSDLCSHKDLVESDTRTSHDGIHRIVLVMAASCPSRINTVSPRDEVYNFG